MDKAPRRAGSERGFALLVVLWWTVLLAVLGAQLATTGQLEARRANYVRAAAMARAAADGLLEEAVFHVLDGSREGWPADGATHIVPVPGGFARVEVRSEAAKVGLNIASAKLLAALLIRLEVAPQQAAVLADAILDWRTATAQPRPLGAKAPDYKAAGLPYAPPNSNFETLDELALVRGMSPELVARLAPYVSVYQAGDPDPALADPLVRLAAGDAGQAVATDIDQIGLIPSAAPVLAIKVTVETAAGARAARRSIVRLAADAAKRPFQLLQAD